MEIEITVYNSTGKWYTSEIVKSDKDIALYKDEFKEFVRKNNPANIGSGFISSKDVGDGFHDFLWKYEDIYM